MNCAVTIDLKPVAFAPSACKPCIPYTERIEQLKIYGDAPVTVSVSTNTCPFAELNPPVEVLIYHKPTGQVCSTISTEENDSVFMHLPPRKKGKWIMAGRLDVNTSGLLVFSNNGNFINYLSHPSSEIDREYLCRVYGDISNKKIDNLLKGVKVNDELSKFSDIVPVKKKSKSKNHWFYVCLFTGKNREVRKLWGSQKLTVNRLIRLRYGPIILPENMKPGGWKIFSKKEVNKLQNLLDIQ